MYITGNQQPTPVENKGRGIATGIDLRGVNIDGLAMDLVKVAIDLDIPLPDTDGNTDLFLIMLTVELQNRLAQAPDLLDPYPEINWINWNQKGVA